MWKASVTSAGSRPTSWGARYSSTAVTTVKARWVKVAQLSPWRPSSLVSTLTITRVIPSGAVRVVLTLVMRTPLPSCHGASRAFSPSWAAPPPASGLGH